jgi:hypothetical protein
MWVAGRDMFLLLRWVQNTQYWFLGVPFGLKHLPAWLQKAMTKLFYGMSFVKVYTDDNVIHSSKVGGAFRARIGYNNKSRVLSRFTKLR